MSASPSHPERWLQRLEWTVLRRLDGVLQGDYRTLFRGFGLDLADLREYQYHDDVRHIDWNVTARLQQPYVREYQEEREVTAWFLVDVTGSVFFGSGERSKRVTAGDFCGLLARVLTRHGNRVGAIVYGRGVQRVVPPGTGRRQPLQLLRALTDEPPGEGPPTDLAAFLGAAAAILPRRSLVFVVSDFISTPGWAQPLGRLATRHEVLAVRLHDPLERELPDLGFVPLQDAETGEQLWIDTHDRAFRRRFHTLAERREAALREGFVAAGVDTLELSTADDLADTLLRHAAARRRRAGNRGFHRYPAAS